MNDNTNIIDVNETDFNDKVIEASESKLIVVDFWAPWCGPCKQLTPILEKIISKSGNKVTLVKINIDENQQIAAQLRIQSIPTVYAFKDKQIVNAFQGVIPENQIVEFIEKCLGSKINEDFTEFYNDITNAMAESKFEEAKDSLLEFISKNSDDIKGICFYLDEKLYNSKVINFHPLLNTTTITISTKEFINFLLENSKKIHIFSLDSYSIVKSL